MVVNTVTGKMRGFTLAELLVVLLLVALLASLTAPVVGRSIEQSKESVLRENLYVIRKALDDYYADKGAYPQNLADLVENKYLRAIPIDPLLASSEQWVLERGGEGEIIDTKSASMGIALDGTRYADW